MTVKQLIRELRHPPSNRIASVRIEFADGSIYAISVGMRQFAALDRRAKKIERTATARPRRCPPALTA